MGLTVKGFLAWWQRTTKLSSLGTELIAGSLAAGFGLVVARGDAGGAFLIAQVVSFFYELCVDPNGFEWKDVGQRTLGIVAVLVLH